MFIASYRYFGLHNSSLRGADRGEVELMVEESPVSMLGQQAEIPRICPRTERYDLFCLVGGIGQREEGVHKGIKSGSASVGSCTE